MINYWKGAKGSKDLLNAFNIEINNLLTSNYAPSDLEKLQHPSQHVIYSYRLNQADRLLFITINGFLYVLEFVPNHDYQKS